MGVSFKVAKTGTRYRPKLLQIEDDDNENGSFIKSQKSANEVYAFMWSLTCVSDSTLFVVFSINGFFYLIDVLVFSSSFFFLSYGLTLFSGSLGFLSWFIIFFVYGSNCMLFFWEQYR